jgi:hypothetical protein
LPNKGKGFYSHHSLTQRSRLRPLPQGRWPGQIQRHGRLTRHLPNQTQLSLIKQELTMNTPKPSDICILMRNVKCLGHEDLITLVSNFTAMLQKPSALGSKCTSVAVDLLDEIVGQIEQDQIDQQQETSWASRKDVPACAGTWTQLDALTVWSQALHKISGRPA